MKKIIVTLVFLNLFIQSSFNQTSTSQFDVQESIVYVGIDMTFNENVFNINASVTYNKFLFGIYADIEKENGSIGEYYSTINWSQFPEDVYGHGSFYEDVLGIEVGYNIFLNLYVGAGIGYSQEVIYKNMFDKYHILGYDGYYNIQKYTGEIITPIKFFGKYRINISDSFSILATVDYSTFTGISFGGGIAMSM